MRIAVISDTHGEIDLVVRKLISIKDVDLILHLGDYSKDAEKISKKLSVKSVIVKGNGDFGTLYNEDELVGIKGKNIFLTHGHRYGVHRNLNNLYYRGLELEADIILYGHTHVPLVLEENGITIMNPGSPTNPRSLDGKLTFGIIDIGDITEFNIVEI
jgi:hypothetical protein